MEYTGQLVTGDFEENTMTFKIDGEMTLQAGRYRIVQIEVGNAVKNNVDLADVGKSCNHQYVPFGCGFDKVCKVCGIVAPVE